MKHDKPILSIIENYDTNDSKFLIGGKKVAITRNDIKLIIGIVCGNKLIGDLNKKKSDVAFATRRGIQEATIGSKKMKDMINEILQKKEESIIDEDIRDVVRFICMFICLMLFFPTSGVTIAWAYVHCMEKIEEIKDYDWVQSIAEILNTSMHKFHDKPRDATGCVVALMRKNVTNYINQRCKKKIKTSAKLLDNAPQQEPGSVDCAVVVAYIIHQKLMKKSIQSDLAKQQCLQKRADIVQAFVSDPKRSWTPEIYHNRMENLRLQKYYDDQEFLEEKKKQA
ncbi:hypothetical protein RHSIM_Rhsim01G0025600 [Rhododendron simsii]|uniref:Ubiquitin-like protease family profile domain-containing protein n=1 Tax=Rhododendron simsii TaxID=118357 RepID=A0A834HHL0_RHOSS|nr:hypothetical protein RHSIM_Rhsim01G0025600 [Rhododendron simsii]